ncbi:hypothetical protein C0J50_6779 [Silurus asotus]|uniref:Uncharacterized protein n=1 Tax=Silurus asotus TaxID=30991 RepID=A0AAD5F9Y2_SILAS|nr:hypothetical protein C0J50_6779 [Silurus asotus]
MAAPEALRRKHLGAIVRYVCEVSNDYATGLQCENGKLQMLQYSLKAAGGGDERRENRQLSHAAASSSRLFGGVRVGM